MKKELKLILGGGPGRSNVADGSKKVEDAIKVEPVRGDDEVFATFKGNKYYHDGFRGRGGYQECDDRVKQYHRHYQQQSRENRRDEKGQVTRCRHCDSKFHYQKNCPDYNKKRKDDGENTENAYVIEEIDFALATQLKDELGQFTRVRTVRLWTRVAPALLLGGPGLTCMSRSCVRRTERK